MTGPTDDPDQDDDARPSGAELARRGAGLFAGGVAVAFVAVAVLSLIIGGVLWALFHFFFVQCRPPVCYA